MQEDDCTARTIFVKPMENDAVVFYEYKLNQAFHKGVYMTVGTLLGIYGLEIAEQRGCKQVDDKWSC
jgi:hypothetical protein